MLLKIQRAIGVRVPETCRMAPWNFPAAPTLHVARILLLRRRIAMNVETRRNQTDGAEVVNTTRARQGVTGHNVRYVLIFGIAGVVIVFALAYMVMR
jgi:hypothetical protein